MLSNSNQTENAVISLLNSKNYDNNQTLTIPTITFLYVLKPVTSDNGLFINELIEL
jgi:hypothetical protein